jgi:hypothetical protein
MKCDIVGVSGNMGSGKDSLYFNFFVPLGYRKYQFSTPLYELARLEYNVMTNNCVDLNMHLIYELFLNAMGGKSCVSWEDTVGFCAVTLPSIAEKTGLVKDIEMNRKPREFLQVLGTDYFREIKEDIWCNYLTKKIISDIRKDVEEYNESLDNEESNLILVGSGNSVEAKIRSKEFVRKIFVSDIRFENELEAVRDLGSKLSYSIPGITSNIKMIKLDIDPNTAKARVSDRDSISKEVVEGSLKHSSEKQLPDNLFDIVCNANQSQVELYVELEKKLGRFV